METLFPEQQTLEEEQGLEATSGGNSKAQFFVRPGYIPIYRNRKL